MSKRVQIIRHIKTAADLFLGLVGEITVNTTDSALRVHDGASIGGVEQARSDLDNVSAATVSNDGKMTAAQAGDLATAKSNIDGHIGSTSGHPVATTSDDGFESAADKTKLDGLPGTPAEILADLLTVDGAGSGLDADLLDGLNPTTAATVSTIMRRDAAGRSQVVSPSGANDIATKGYADANPIASLTVAGHVERATDSEASAGSDTTRYITPKHLSDNIPGVLPSGTKLLFQQTSAPIGWTKDTTHNNKALRVVTGSVGSGGATNFTSLFGSGKTTGNASPGFAAHFHIPRSNTTSVGAATNVRVGTFDATAIDVKLSTTTVGSGSSHSHTLSLDLKYMDVIVATKD